jgi:hypothetical protein
MEEHQLEQEVIELDNVTLVINGSPSSEACESFLKLVQQMKVNQKHN